MELESKTIIITGASSGIGAAAANLFTQEGANVVLGARRSAELSQLTDQINDKNLGKAIFLAGDVNDGAYAQKLVDLALSKFGQLDGAFNNAGTVGDMKPVADMSDDNWHQVLDTNLTSAFLLARAQIPALQKQKNGALVFTSSFVGFSNAGLPGMAAYAAAKSGLIGFVQSLAAEHAAEGIRINTLLPGGTKTAMAGDDPAGHAFIEGLHPMKRMARPEEIAQAALFLLSDRASFVTGSPLVADGGISVRLV